MIGCVTPNVAIDRTYFVPGFTQGGVFRPQTAIAAAGGKGLNVARAARTLGGEPLCAGFLAGHAGRLAAELVEAEGMASHWTMLDEGETRTCVIMADPDADTTSVINEAGPETSTQDWLRLMDDMLSQAERFTHVCFCGSLPPGSPLDLFSELLRKLVMAGKTVWVDASGAVLRETEAARKSICLKINRHEASEFLKFAIQDLADASVAAHALSERMSAPAVITLGSRGAIYSDGKQTWYAKPPSVTVKSAVGSGDTLLAGLLVGLERGYSPADALAYGVAAGTANAMSFGGASFTREEVDTLLPQVVCEVV